MISANRLAWCFWTFVKYSIEKYIDTLSCSPPSNFQQKTTKKIQIINLSSNLGFDVLIVYVSQLYINMGGSKN